MRKIYLPQALSRNRFFGADVPELRQNVLFFANSFSAKSDAGDRCVTTKSPHIFGKMRLASTAGLVLNVLIKLSLAWRKRFIHE